MVTIKQSEDIIQGTKKHIIEVARKLFSEYSYLGSSMSDIAKKLDITKAALYYHFNSKAEIYKKVLDEVFVDLNLSLIEALNEKTIDKKLHRCIKNYLDFGYKEKNLIKALMLKTSSVDNKMKKYIIDFRNQISKLIQPLIKEIIVSKKLDQKVDSKLATSLLIGMMDGLLMEYSFLNKKIDVEKTSTQIIIVMSLLKTKKVYE